METQTSVQTVDLDIDSWLGAPGAESIVTPAATTQEEKKPSVFSAPKTDLSFIDQEDEEEEEKKDDQNVDKPVSRETF